MGGKHKTSPTQEARCGLALMNSNSKPYSDNAFITPHIKESDPRSFKNNSCAIHRLCRTHKPKTITKKAPPYPSAIILTSSKTITDITKASLSAYTMHR